MKKIVGIIAAVAMAASTFAVDFTAGARLSGDLFSYNGADKSMSLMKIKNENQFWHSPVTFTVSSDKAGATVKFTEGDGDTVKAGKWAIWFKPVDMIKVDLGTIDASMNTESIDWGGRVLNYDSFGFRATANIDALSIAVALVPGSNAYWMTKADGADAVIKELNVAVTYGAGDAGTFSAMFDYTGKTVTAATAATKTPKWDAETGAYVAEVVPAKPAVETPAVSKIAAGYKNKFGDITVFADGAYNLQKDNNTYAADFDVAYAADGINAQVYVKYDNYIRTDNGKVIDTDEKNLCVIAKASYAMDGITPYIYFKSADLIVDGDVAFTVKPGVTGSVGIMNYEVAAQFDIANKVSVSVPVNFAVAF